MISTIWVFFIVISLIFAILTGRVENLSSAVTNGTKNAVQLWIGISGIMCFWSGIMEIISESGLSSKISKGLMPVLKKIFSKKVSKDKEAMEEVSSNVTANLLGISNAATPIGLRAADRIYTLCGRAGTPNDVLMLIILNTASIQIIPSTIAAVRATLGAQDPFDIMPAVWGASILSVLAACISAKVLSNIWK